MIRGDIWWADFGIPFGSEPGFRRPVLIIQSDAFNKIWVGTKNGSLYVYDNTLSTGKCIYKNINPYGKKY